MVEFRVKERIRQVAPSYDEAHPWRVVYLKEETQLQWLLRPPER